MDEVSQNRRNLMMMWFDYKKAFEWIIRALQLAKVPNDNMGCQTQITNRERDNRN